jgi:hypothetical protein
MSELLKSEAKKQLKIYLDEPIEIHGIKITHTQEGLEFLIQHYKHMLTMNPVNKVTGPARSKQDSEHMLKLIENWTIHLELYKKKEAEKLSM